MWNRIRRKIWIEHSTRNCSRITIIIEGKLEGKPSRGKPRTPFMQQMMEDTVIKSYKWLKRTIKTEERQRKMEGDINYFINLRI